MLFEGMPWPVILFVGFIFMLIGLHRGDMIYKKRNDEN
jgi:hypothetical protein